jgi:hypothetical protein
MVGPALKTNIAFIQINLPVLKLSTYLQENDFCKRHYWFIIKSTDTTILHSVLEKNSALAFSLTI